MAGCDVGFVACCADVGVSSLMVLVAHTVWQFLEYLGDSVPTFVEDILSWERLGLVANAAASPLDVEPGKQPALWDFQPELQWGSSGRFAVAG